MRRKFRRQVSRAAMRSPYLGGLALLVLIVIVASHRFGLISAKDLLIGIGGSAVVALCGLALALKGFSDLWVRGDKGGRASIKGMILSLVTLAPLILAAALWLYMPPFYDISSDLDNPPSLPPSFLNSVARPQNAPVLVDDFTEQADEQQARWPNLIGRRYDSSPDRILTAVEAVVEAQGWLIQFPPVTESEGSEILLIALARVPIIGFTSDVVIRLHDEEEATRVDMRVISRDLPYDFGFGAHTILAFMKALDREVLLTGMEQRQED